MSFLPKWESISLFLMIIIPLIGYSQSQLNGEVEFLSWATKEIQKIQKIEKNSKNKEIKLKPILQSKNLLRGVDLKNDENTIDVDLSDEFIYTQINQLFEGSSKKASSLYWAITLGEKFPSLFIESGAGAKEEISNIKKGKNVAEFVTDRMYKSSLAFNTKTITRLRRFDIPDKKIIMVVNELVKDWGSELAKPYGPVYFDLIVDVYQQVDTTHFRYQSFSTFKGQGLKSNNQAFNVAKDVGDIFSLGMLNKGLKAKVVSEATAIWQKRKEVFQQLLLNK